MDSDGNEIWRYVGEEEIASITSSQHVSLLNNDQILLISRVDKRFDSQYLINDWYPFPAKFSFLSSEGIHIRDTIFNTPNDVEPVVEGVKTSKESDIFVFGSWEDEEEFGWLLKMTNEGEILWSKKYKHPKYKDTGHLFEIVDIHEYDNGDIVAVGTAHIIGEKNEIWTLQAGVFPENKGSIIIHERLGFRKVGYREKIGKMNGVWRDTVLLERRSDKIGVK